MPVGFSLLGLQGGAKGVYPLSDAIGGVALLSVTAPVVFSGVTRWWSARRGNMWSPWHSFGEQAYE